MRMRTLKTRDHGSWLATPPHLHCVCSKEMASTSARLSGKVVFITGAAQGIGRATALVRNDIGSASVIMHAGPGCQSPPEAQITMRAVIMVVGSSTFATVWYYFWLPVHVTGYGWGDLCTHSHLKYV